MGVLQVRYLPRMSFIKRFEQNWTVSANSTTTNHRTVAILLSSLQFLSCRVILAYAMGPPRHDVTNRTPILGMQRALAVFLWPRHTGAYKAGCCLSNFRKLLYIPRLIAKDLSSPQQAPKPPTIADHQSTLLRGTQLPNPDPATPCFAKVRIRICCNT